MSGILPYLRSFRRPLAPSETDGELLRRFRLQRDEQAFAALVHRHGPMVLGIARRIVGQTDLAEDVFQAAFLVAAQRAKQLKHWPSIAGWLVQVTRRTALQAKAKAARRFRHEQQAAAMMTSTTISEPTKAANQRDVAELLDFELSRLPGKYRTPLVLCHLQGRTKEEAAQQLGWPVGSVSGRLARGKQFLKARLLRRGVVPTLTTGLLSVPRLEAGIPPLLVQATTLLANSIVHKTCPIPASAVVALAQGVMTTMFLTKLKWAVVAVVILCVGVTGGVWAWGETGAASQEQAKAPAITTKPATLLEQLQGDWKEDGVTTLRGSGLGNTEKNGRFLGSGAWWRFQGKELKRFDVPGSYSNWSWPFELTEAPTGNKFEVADFVGTLNLKDGIVVISLSNKGQLQEAYRISLRRATDYDRVEGIWRNEVRNPVTNDLDKVVEYIFRKNFYVERYYSKHRNDTILHFQENPPQKFELHENLIPKGVDWIYATAQDLEEQNLNRTDVQDKDMILNNLVKSFGTSERFLGIYELTANEFRVFNRGSVPFKVKDSHLVPDLNAPTAKRPTSFAEAGDKLKVFKRVERSLKDQPGIGATQKEQSPAPVEPASRTNPSTPAPSAKLQDLRQQRLKLAQERMDLARQEYETKERRLRLASERGDLPSGMYEEHLKSLEQLVPIAQKLADAKLALAKDKKERLQALEEQLQVVKQIAEQFDERNKSGKKGITRNDVLTAELRRLELEIQIEELKAQP
jgi:RNA polymerase sigma factor (sigma-70 family)